MKIQFSKVDQAVLNIIRSIGRSADEMGLTAYVVGGFVRDALLKRPNWDVDIVVEGDALRLAEQLAQTQKTTLTMFRQFGTATLGYGELRVDLASARKESYPRPGALPVVERGNIRDDLFRRDFTINALAAYINPACFGEMVDFFKGMDDLRSKDIRVLHQKSFIDDPTRILRAVRFEQRFNFPMEKDTLNYLKTAITKKAVQAVTPGRYFGEVRKVLKEDQPVKSIIRLEKLKGWGFVHRTYRPPLSLLKRIDKNIASLRKDTFYKNKDWSGVYLVSLFCAQTPKRIHELVTRFHLTKEERANLLAAHDLTRLKKLDQKKISPSKVYEILRKLPQDVVCFALSVQWESAAGKQLDQFLKTFSRVRVQISGEDVKALGLSSGQAIGQVLEKILLMKVDGKVLSRQDELNKAKQLIGKDFSKKVEV